MEDDLHGWKYVCKLCNKKYPCGKSLGGHMRSHVIASNLAESDEKVEHNMKASSCLVNNNNNGVGGGKFPKKESKLVVDQQFGGGGGGVGGGGGSVGADQNLAYGLRENPKKTWRAVDQNSPLPQEKVCKQCGKVFQSLKALCGHMACHSEKERGGGTKDDHSWTSENQKLAMDSHSHSHSPSHSNTEVEDHNRKLRSRSKTKRYKTIIIKSSSYSLAANNASSSVSEIDEQVQEEVAISLMMLSRDSGNKGGVNSVVESSDNNSVVLETKSSSIDMLIGKKEGLNCFDNRETSPKAKKIIGDDWKLNFSGFDAEIAQPDNSDSGYFLGEATKGESDVSVDGVRRNAAYWDCRKLKKTIGGAKYEESGAEMRKGVKIKGYKTELRKESAKENGFSNGGLAPISGKYESSVKRRRDSFDDDDVVAESYKRIKYGSSPNAEASNNAHKRSKYECLNCKKIFKSYQALGGHRPCHKRINACLQPRYDSGDNSSGADNVADCKPSVKLTQTLSTKKAIAKDVARKAEKKIKSKKHKGHVCPFCQRVFKSGQALGGHKRSHFLGGNEENSGQSPMIKPEEVHDLFDLNLPAPAEDEDDGRVQFASW